MSRKIFTPETFVDHTGWPLTISLNTEGQKPGWSAWSGTTTGYGPTPTEAVTDLVYTMAADAFAQWLAMSERVVDARERLDEILEVVGLCESDLISERGEAARSSWVGEK